MEKKVLTAMAVAIGLIMVIVVLKETVFARLPAQARTSYAQELEALSSAEATVAQRIQDLEAKIASTPGLDVAATSSGWTDRLARARDSLVEAKSSFGKKADPILEENKREDASALLSLVSSASSARKQADVLIDEVATEVKDLESFVTNKDEWFSKASTAAQKIASHDFSSIQAVGAKATEAWPEKRADVQSRLSDLTKSASEAATTAAALEQAKGQPLDQISPTAVYGQIQSLMQTAEGLPDREKALATLFGQLDRSFDKILIDMDIREGELVEFYHRHKVITVDGDAEPAVTEEWQKVSKRVFVANEKNLGMALESKPKGLYDFEAIKQATPPGFAYMTDKGNNRYGRWERRSDGSSIWKWATAYLVMDRLFWGGGRYPVTQSSYRGYRDHRSSGRTYYGGTNSQKPRYGTSGTYSSSRYSQSKYQKSGGFKNSQYKKSGGSYRGSRFTRKSSSSSRSYSRGSRSFGGSRSSGK